jgi:hypothetical protein
MPNKLMFVLLLAALLAGILAPATAWAQTPPSDLVYCESSMDDQGNATYAIAWGPLPGTQPIVLMIFLADDWVLGVYIGPESGSHPLDPGLWPWAVPSLDIYERTCGSPILDRAVFLPLIRMDQ